MLFQDNNIFPHLTVETKHRLSFSTKFVAQSETKAQVKQIATQMGIETFLQRQADQLSGDQKQRVALARTLLRDKPILCGRTLLHPRPATPSRITANRV